MRGEDRQALKEWAAVEAALAAGAVTVLLRKGGIHERQGEFRVEHREFWIYPSGWHQNPDDLAPRLRPYLDALGPEPRGTVPFRTYCTVRRVLRIERTEALDRLAGMHPLSAPAAHDRFAYKDRPYVHALLVRAHVLPAPVVLPEHHRYAGCVSWVRLETPIATDALRPVLSDEDFTTRAGEILRRLGTEGVVEV